MLNFIYFLIIGCLWCFGVYKLMDGLLARLAAKIEMRLTAYWCLPLFLCPPCMGSFHGVLVFLLIGPAIVGQIPPIPSLIPYCICLCGLNYIVNQLIPE